MGTVFLLVFIIGTVLGTLQVSESVWTGSCGGMFNTSAATPINLTLSDVQNQTCIWIIERPDNDNQTNIGLMLTIGGSNGSVAVYSGKYDNKTKNSSNLIKMYTAGQSVQELVISTNNITTIVLTATNNTSGSLFADFDSDACVRTVDWTTGLIASPVYLPLTGKITCQYVVALPSNGKMHVMAFTNFNMPSGMLAVHTGKTTTMWTGKALPDDIFVSVENNLTASMVINNSSSPQQFTAFITEADPVCSKQIKLNGSGPITYQLPADVSLPLDCRIVVTSSNSTTIVARFLDLSLLGGSNSVSIRDGGSQSSQSIISSVLPAGQVIVSSGNKLWMQVRLSKSLVTSVLKVKLMQQGGGAGRYESKGSINFVASNSKTNTSSYVLITVPDGKAQVEFLNASMKKASIQVFDDATETKQLALFTDSSSFYTVTGSGQQLLLVANNFVKGSDKQGFNAKYQPALPGCDSLSTGLSGGYSLIGRNGSKCTWSIKAQESVSLVTLTLGHVSLCQNDTLSVYAGLTKKKALVVVKKNTQSSQIPVIYNQNQDGLRLELNSPVGSCQGNISAQVQASYQTLQSECTGSLSSKAGSVTSPLYPGLYPLHAKCKWQFNPGKMTHILLEVVSLDLNPKHSLSLDNNGKKISLADYTTTNLMVDVTNKTKYVLDFDSTPPSLPTTGRGFIISYKFLDCGKMSTDGSGTITLGNVTQNTTKECIWVIQVPGKVNTTNIISFNLTFKGNNTRDIVIYDGGSRSCPVLRLNMTSGTASALSRTNSIVVSYNHTGLTSQLSNTSAFIFKIHYQTHACTNLCGNGVCLHEDWKCNGVNDCGDNTDEINCRDVPIPSTPKPANTPSKGVKSYVVAVVALVCFAFGIAIAFAIPALYRRIKYPNYRHLQDLSVTT